MSRISPYIDPVTDDIVVDSDTLNLRFTTDIGEYVSQKMETVLLTFLNEWFLDPDIGIPYLDQENRRDKTKNVFIKNPDIDLINNYFKVAIIGITEISEILEFETEFDIATRTYSLTYSVLAEEEIVSGTITI